MTLMLQVVLQVVLPVVLQEVLPPEVVLRLVLREALGTSLHLPPHQSTFPWAEMTFPYNFPRPLYNRC